jgi:hypothetical protein
VHMLGHYIELVHVIGISFDENICILLVFHFHCSFTFLIESSFDSHSVLNPITLIRALKFCAVLRVSWCSSNCIFFSQLLLTEIF